ncbi:MAG: DUF6477 family protein [Rhodobacteraceae bacterium]|nr:DUF6477 family protein [Paracoccaceae bacterium]
MDHAPSPPTQIAALRRPALLVRAARIGLAGYRRARDLGRVLGAEPPRDSGTVVALLADMEAMMELRRRCGTGGYVPSVHVALLIALMAEHRVPDGGGSS